MTPRHALWLGALAAVLAAGSPGFASRDGTACDSRSEHAVDREPPPESKVEGGPVPPETTRTPEAGPEAESTQAAIQRQVAQLKRLEQAMLDKLNLTADQKKAISQLFRDRLYTIRQGQRGDQRHDADAKDAEEIKALRDRLKQARQAGDEQTVSEIRTQLRDRLKDRMGAEGNPTADFLDKLAAELDEDQRGEFRKLARRLGIDKPEGPRDRELRRLWQAVRKPEAGLSEGQQRAVGAIVRDAAKALAEDDVTAERAEQITAKARSDVFKELTPEQQAKVETAMKTAEQRGAKRKGDRPGRTEYPTPYPDDARADRAPAEPTGDAGEPAAHDEPEDD